MRPSPVPLLALLLAAPAPAQQFVRVDAELPSTAAPPLPEPWQLDRGVLQHAFDREGWSAMRATAPPGAVRALARVPAGTWFAACERGLFVCDEQHPVLDPADVRDGVVAGPLVGVAADARGRVWLCGVDSFGVLDPALRFGRVFTAADGLPAPPFRGVAVAADGRVILTAANGAFAYTPDAEPPPRATAVPDASRSLRASPDGTVDVPVGAEGRGGATLRVRRRHHHMLVPLVDGRVSGLRPGRHVLEVHAVDRDLNRTVVGEYTVDVPLPRVFDPRLLLGAAAFGAALLFAAAYRARRGQRTGARLAWAAARTAVLAVVLLQLLAALLGYGRSWPFVGFTMYTETWREDDVLYRPRITGVRADGSRTSLHEHEVGVHQDGYWQMLAEVAFGGDAAARALFAKVARCRRDGETPFTGFVLADGRIRLTANGPVDVAPTVLVAWSAR